MTLAQISKTYTVSLDGAPVDRPAAPMTLRNRPRLSRSKMNPALDKIIQKRSESLVVLSHTHETAAQASKNAELMRGADFNDFLSIPFEHTTVAYEIDGNGNVTSNGYPVELPADVSFSNNTKLWTDAHKAIINMVGLEGFDWECGYPTNIRHSRS
jgi:hypothetical protein